MDSEKTTEKGLLVSILSSIPTITGKTAILVGDGVPGIFDATSEKTVLRLEKRHGILIARTPRGKSFNGNFIYSSDGRFPGNHPIRIFDRWESDGQAFSDLIGGR